MTTTSVPTETSAHTSSSLVRAFQIFAALAVVNVLVQFITAGQLFPSGGPDGIHAAGAIVLHVLSGLAAVAAVLLWRQGRASITTAALAAIVFAYSFLQAYWGGYSSLWIHVPGAMLLTVGVVWVLFTSLRPSARRA